MMINKYAIMQYQDNSTAIKLGYLSLIMNAIFLIKTLNVVTPVFLIGVKILFNILLMLLILLFSEEAKKYIKGSGYKLIGLGILALIRILWIPLSVIKSTEYDTFTGIFLLLLLVIEGAILIISGIITTKKVNGLSKYISEHVEDQHG